MCLTWYLFKYCGFDVRSSPLGPLHGTKNEMKSFQYKLLILRMNFIVMPLMVFFYWLHNATCRPYVYTFFCLTEYAVVLLNMSFHMCAYLDFYGLSVEVPSVINSKTYLIESRKNEKELLPR